MNHPTFHGLTWFDRFDVTDGDLLTSIEIGNLVFLTQKPLQIPHLTEKLADLMDEAGLTLADLLQGLDEERKRIWRESISNVTLP